MLMQRQGHNDIGDEGWAATRQAARVLNVIPRRVRDYIAAGDLEGRKEGKGVNERWLVSIPSVEALRQKRHSEGKHSVQNRDVAGEADDTGRSSEGNPALTRELAKRLEAVQYELGRTEARLALLAQADKTLQERNPRTRAGEG
jgi:hypothetical protein